MWDVKSDQGKLGAVLVHDASYVSYERNPVLPAMSKNIIYEKSAPQLQQLYQFLRDEGVKVFELSEIIKGIVDKATIKEKKGIIEKIWKKETQKPKAEELRYEHILYGYPFEPYYDEKTGKIVLPDSLWRTRFGIYARDPSFGTQIGHVISKMRRRTNEPRVVRLAFEMDPILQKNAKVVYDAELDEESIELGGAIEGGDHIVVDENTIAVGVGQRSNYAGFFRYVKGLFDKDVDKQLKYICAVRMPGEEYTISHSHLDTSINFVDKGKVLVQPYIHDSEIVDIFPQKKMLAKLVQSYRDMAEKNYDKGTLGSLYTAKTFSDTTETLVYGRDGHGKIKRLKVEKNFIDFLIKEEKIEKDGIIMVSGEAKNKTDVMHLIHAQQEQNRQAPNIVAIKPGHIIAYEENWRTLENLKNHNIKVKKLPNAYLDLGGGPHCLTCPLQRDPA